MSGFRIFSRLQRIGKEFEEPSDEQSKFPLAGIPMELNKGGGGHEVFDSEEAAQLNRARLQHLDSLQLDLSGKSVLDLGCGVGHLARYFLERDCKVTCADGRFENIEELRRRLPGVLAHVIRADSDGLSRLGVFDIVFCYGLLYHLENPIAGLRNIASVCEEFLILETVVSDHEIPLVRLVDEPRHTMNQALEGLGCRPSPSFVAMALTRVGFEFVYQPAVAPDHPDFRFSRLNNLDCSRDGHLLRSIFIASRRELTNSRLKLLLSAPSGRNAPMHFSPAVGSTAERVWLDVGAHLGEKTYAAAKRDANLRVYAFEPNLKIAAKQMGQLANYIVLPLAVSEQNGSATFHVNALEAASSLLELNSEGLNNWIGKEQLRIEQTITVPTMRLDTFLNEAGLQRVEYLKIDAQGADFAVVKSCGDRLRDIECIELEVQITQSPLYRDAASRDDILRFMEGAGFELETVEPQSNGQEENLVFVRLMNQDAMALLGEARDLAVLLPLQPRPEWYFGCKWDNPDPYVRRRRRIWTYFHRQNAPVLLEFDWYHGLTLGLYLGNDTSCALFVEGAIDPNEFAFLDHFLQADMIVVDAGANEGLYTLFAANRVGDKGLVLSFEPSSRELLRLRANIERNALHNVLVFPFALGESEKTATLRVAASEHSGQNTLGGFIYDDVRLSSEETVSLRSLDGLITELNIARLDLLKVDVEGSETNIIRGAAQAIKKYHPLLLLEVADEALRNQSSNQEQLLDLLESFGYVLYTFDKSSGLPEVAKRGEAGANFIAAYGENSLPGSLRAATPSEDAGRRQSRLVEVCSLFDLSERCIFNNSKVSGNGPVFVTTVSQQWSFAVGFNVKEASWRSVRPTAEIRVIIKLDVEAGEIGIGIVNRELSAYVATEMRYGASSDIVCEIALRYLPPDSILVLRNTAKSGVVSRAIVRSIAAFVVGD